MYIYIYIYIHIVSKMILIAVPQKEGIRKGGPEQNTDMFE